MKKKTPPKVKEPIKIRFKELSNGTKSIYLDCYIDGKREYRFLKLYINPQNDTATQTANAENLRLANAIKADLTVELQNKANGFSVRSKKNKTYFLEYVKHISEKKGDKESYIALQKHLKDFCDKTLIIQNVDKEFCAKFAEYLKNVKNIRTGNNIHTNTQFEYLRKLTTILRAAISDGLIEKNPLLEIDKPKQKEAEIEYLTADEVKILETTDCKSQKIKNAFLFSCFTGLRFSDVKLLTWEQIKRDNDRVLIEYTQKKTKKHEYLPLPKKAAEYLSKSENNPYNENIFNLQSNEYVNNTLKLWAAAAGIKKRLTFHMARHTYATLLLNKGAAIEVVSKALGHSDIKTTQRYAKITDFTLLEAVKTLDEL
jgi:integrase